MKATKAVAATALAVLTLIMAVGSFENSDTRSLSDKGGQLHVVDTVSWGWLLTSLVFLVLTVILVWQAVRNWRVAK